MAYSPVEWNTGDVITAAKLNNMDGGISANADNIESLSTNLGETSEEVTNILSKIGNITSIGMANLGTQTECVAIVFTIESVVYRLLLYTNASYTYAIGLFDASFNAIWRVARV